MDIVLAMLVGLIWYWIGLVGCILVYTFESYEQRFVENPDTGEIILVLAVSLLGPILLFPSLLLVVAGGLKGMSYGLRFLEYGFIIPYMERNEYLFGGFGVVDTSIRAHLRPELRQGQGRMPWR